MRTRKAAIASCLVLAFLASLPAFAQTPLNVADQRQLLLDDRFVQQAKAIEFTVHQPRKTGDISIPSEEGWALGGYSSVLQYGGLYHMWYTARTAICYARSTDGIHWERPRFRLA